MGYTIIVWKEEEIKEIIQNFISMILMFYLFNLYFIHI